MNSLIALLLSLLISTDAYRIVTSTRRAVASLSMVVNAKSVYSVTLLPGDGIGPEIMTATLPVLEAVGNKGDPRY